MKRKHRILLFLIGSIIWLIQILYGNQLDVQGVRPNLWLVWAVLNALMVSPSAGITVGLTSGLAYDLLFARIPGISALIAWFCTWLISRADKRIFNENLIVAVVATGISSFIFEIVSGIASLVYFGWRNPLPLFTSKILPAVAYNMILAVPFFFIALLCAIRIESSDRAVRQYASYR